MARARGKRRMANVYSRGRGQGRGDPGAWREVGGRIRYSVPNAKEFRAFSKLAPLLRIRVRYSAPEFRRSLHRTRHDGADRSGAAR
jgi:hypothetical protein